MPLRIPHRRREYEMVPRGKMQRRGLGLLRYLAAAVAMLVAACAMAWLVLYPGLRGEVSTIPARVHAVLRAHHERYAYAIPGVMEHAIVSVEDRRFYEEHGIDPYGMARAAYVDATTRSLSQGGATISEQLVENTLPLSHFLPVRALQVFALSWVANDRFSKGRILQYYLNAIYYGRHAYGIGAAARAYFHKPLGGISVAQAALLAALPQAPSFYGTHLRSRVFRSRWRTVIADMAAQGYISQQREELALSVAKKHGHTMVTAESGETGS